MWNDIKKKRRRKRECVCFIKTREKAVTWENLKIPAEFLAGFSFVTAYSCFLQPLKLKTKICDRCCSEVTTTKILQ